MAKADPHSFDPSLIARHVRLSLMRRDVRDAAKVYKMHGVKMVVGDSDGNIREIDPDEILNRKDSPAQKAVG